MSIKRILVHLDEEVENKIKLNTAIILAKRYNATVTAILVRPIGEQMFVSALASPPALIDVSNIEDHTQQEFIQQKQIKAQKLVERQERLHRFPVKFLTYTGEPKHILAEKSHCFDLMIVSSSIEEEYQLRMVSLPSNNLAMKSGCPLLILPQGTQLNGTFKKPILAWNGTPESARAISDSLPFLTEAEDVSVVSLNESKNSFSSKKELDTDLVEYLRLHRVYASLVNNNLNESNNIEDEVNEIIDGQDNDLLVIGAYGHSQLRELFFNSQTKSILSNAKVPVLLSR